MVSSPPARQRAGPCEAAAKTEERSSFGWAAQRQEAEAMGGSTSVLQGGGPCLDRRRLPRRLGCASSRRGSGYREGPPRGCKVAWPQGAGARKQEAGVALCHWVSRGAPGEEPTDLWGPCRRKCRSGLACDCGEPRAEDGHLSRRSAPPACSLWAGLADWLMPPTFSGRILGLLNQMLVFRNGNSIG